MTLDWLTFELIDSFLIKILFSSPSSVRRRDRRESTATSLVAAVGSSVLDPVKNKTRAGGRRKTTSTQRRSVYDGTDRTRDRSTGSSRRSTPVSGRIEARPTQTTGLRRRPIRRRIKARVLRDGLLRQRADRETVCSSQWADREESVYSSQWVDREKSSLP